MKAKDDLLHEQLTKKDEMIKMLQCQLRLNEEMHQNAKENADENMKSHDGLNEETRNENVSRQQIDKENQERMKELRENLVSLGVRVDTVRFN